MKAKPEGAKWYSPEIVFEEKDGKIRLADIPMAIGNTLQLPLNSIDEMVARRHDLDYQLGLCRKMMPEGLILPYPFERAAILLRKAKRYHEELELCRYVAEWSKRDETTWDGRSAKVWQSPVLRACIARIPRVERLLEKARAEGNK